MGEMVNVDAMGEDALFQPIWQRQLEPRGLQSL